MLKIVQCIDGLNTRIFSVLKWLLLIMVLVAAYNAVARYISQPLGVNLSSNSLIEIQWYLFSVIFLLGAAGAFKDNVHVRVDIIYNHLSSNGKAWINVIGTICFLMPFCAITFYVCMVWVGNSWAVMEVSPDPGGLPRYPIKTLVPVSVGLLMLQGISELIKSVFVLIENPENRKPESISN